MGSDTARHGTAEADPQLAAMPDAELAEKINGARRGAESARATAYKLADVYARLTAEAYRRTGRWS